MKKTFQLFNYVAVLFIAITSCHKDPGNYDFPPPQPVIDTLQGKEFSFSDLTWDYSLDDFGELYIDIGNRADLFRKYRLVEVSVKSVTDSTWVTAHGYNLTSYLGYVGYLFSIERGHLYVLPFPYIYRSSGNTQLAGSKASLKVKFL